MKKIHRHNRNIFVKMIFRTDIRLRHALRHFKFFVKWLVLSVVIGIVCGIIGSAFHYAVDFADHSASQYPHLLYFLPVSGLIIVFCYRKLNILNDGGTNSILRAARAEDTTALRITPLIFGATFLTHLCGGSAGREGAALQIGGSLGSFISRKLKLGKYEQQLMVMCGMSATFCALFAAPLTAAFFSIEVAGVGTVFYAGLVPSVTASFIAMLISRLLGVSAMSFDIAAAQPVNVEVFIKVIFIAMMTALLSIIYCSAMHNSTRLYKKYIENPYIRIITGAFIVIAATMIIGNRDYNSAGMDKISEALSGSAVPEAFILKLLLTAITLGAGFKGGEIIPTMFIGSTFGCTIGAFLGLDPLLSAEIGLIGLFCGVVNCPLSSILLSVELFGSGNFILFGVTAAVTYMLSGYYSLYSGQKFMNSKLMPITFEKSAK